MAGRPCNRIGEKHFDLLSTFGIQPAAEIGFQDIIPGRQRVQGQARGFSAGDCVERARLEQVLDRRGGQLRRDLAQARFADQAPR